MPGADLDETEGHRDQIDDFLMGIDSHNPEDDPNDEGDDEDQSWDEDCD